MAAYLELMRELSIEDGPYGVIEQTTADEAAPAVAADSGVRRGSPLLAAMAAWLRSALFRSDSPPWTAVVAAVRQSCQKPTLGKYSCRRAWRTVEISCEKVRS
jgi:hypothetical protein